MSDSFVSSPENTAILLCLLANVLKGFFPPSSTPGESGGAKNVKGSDGILDVNEEAESLVGGFREAL